MVASFQELSGLQPASTPLDLVFVGFVAESVLTLAKRKQALLSRSVAGFIQHVQDVNNMVIDDLDDLNYSTIPTHLPLGEEHTFDPAVIFFQEARPKKRVVVRNREGRPPKAEVARCLRVRDWRSAPPQQSPILWL